MKTLITSALALLVLAAPSGAQSLLSASTGTARIVADDPPRVSARVVGALTSPADAERAEALHAVLTLVFDSAEGADLRPAVPALLSVFREDDDARHRALALRCLEAAGDDAAMAVLRTEADRETDPAVQRLLFSVLLDHYGADELRQDARFMSLAHAVQANVRG